MAIVCPFFTVSPSDAKIFSMRPDTGGFISRRFRGFTSPAIRKVIAIGPLVGVISLNVIVVCRFFTTNQKAAAPMITTAVIRINFFIILFSLTEQISPVCFCKQGVPDGTDIGPVCADIAIFDRVPIVVSREIVDILCRGYL